MTGFALATIKTLLILSSNDAYWHEGTIASYAGETNHLRRRHASDSVITKTDEYVRNFKPGSLTTWDVSQKLWDLNLLIDRRV